MLREWGCDYIQGRLIGLASSQRPWGGAARRCCRRRARLVALPRVAVAPKRRDPYRVIYRFKKAV